MKKFKHSRYPNIEHTKVQSAGSSIRRNKVDPGPGFVGSAKKSRGSKWKSSEIQIIKI